MLEVVCDDVDARIYSNSIRVCFTAFHASFRQTDAKRWLLSVLYLQDYNLVKTFPVWNISRSLSCQTPFSIGLAQPRGVAGHLILFCSRSIHDAVHKTRSFVFFASKYFYILYLGSKFPLGKKKSPNLDRVARTDKKPAAFLVSCLLGKIT